MEPDEFPILDSISVTLLNQYYRDYCSDDTQKEINRKSKWGNYQCYKEDYKTILNKLGLSTTNSTYSFKKFDIFLWTYGVLISKYWEEVGVISFNSIEYKAPNKNK